MRALCETSVVSCPGRGTAHFPHSDPPLFTIRKCGERQREVYQKGLRTAHLNFWDKEKTQYQGFHSFELIIHACVDDWFSGVFPG